MSQKGAAHPTEDACMNRSYYILNKRGLIIPPPLKKYVQQA